MRDPYKEPLSAGIGCLKTMLGVYVLIIVTIFAVAGKYHEVPEEDSYAVETMNTEAEDEYVILSYDNRVFAIDDQSYESYM